MGRARSALRRWSTAAALGLTAGLAVVSSAAPVSATGPSATISPSTSLTDLQVVKVAGSGFPPYTRIEIMECAGTPANPPKDNTSCQGLTIDNRPVTDAKGSFVDEPNDPRGQTFGFQILQLPRKRFPPYPPFCNPTHACVLFVGVDETDFTQPHTFVAFRLGDAPAAHRGGGGGGIAGGVAVVVILVVIGALVLLRRHRRRCV